MEYSDAERKLSRTCERLVDAQRQRIERAYDETRQALEERWKQGDDAVGQRIAAAKRALEEARKAGRPTADLALELNRAERDRYLGAPRVARFLDDARCYGWADEAWVLQRAEPKIEAPQGGSRQRWELVGSHELVHVARSGRHERLSLEGVSDQSIERMRQDDPVLVDFDRDGSLEILWVIWEHPDDRTYVWTAEAGEIKEWTQAIPVPGEVRQVGAEDGGRRGTLTYRVALDDSDACLDDDMEIEHDPTVYSAPLLAEVIEGQLVLDSASTREVVREWCPRHPGPDWKTGDEVLCARLWGEETASLLDAIDSRFSPADCATTPHDPPPSGRSREYAAMQVAARWSPPFRLESGVQR